MRVAAIGIGSNSLRMLIADIENAQLHRLLRDRAGLRVFAALDENGNITKDMLAQATKSVQGMLDKAKQLGAQRVHIFATSAVRDANNQLAFCQQLEAATGIRPVVCSGEEEAALSFLGATGGQRAGMIDIGGGSTELVVGRGDKLDYACSLQMGAVRLYGQMPITCASQTVAVVDRAKALLLPSIKPLRLTDRDTPWYGVGGTFTTAAALVQDIPWQDKQRIHDYIITKEDVRQTMLRLADMTLEQRLQLKGLQPQRADIVVHGFAILLGCMESLALPHITVSEYGNLEGYIQRYDCE